MRPEQVTKLADLEEKLTDLYAVECTPDKWKAAQTQGLAAKEQAYRDKRNALATLQHINKIQTVLREIRTNDPPADGPKTAPVKGEEREGDEIAREAAELERRGRSVLKRHGKQVH